MSRKADIPPHLAEANWLEYEQEIALKVCEHILAELKVLKEGYSTKSVHNTRISLRRWNSIWFVLKDDGWLTKKFDKKISSRLKKLIKTLGELRDWDVNCKLAGKLKLPKPVLDFVDARRSAIRRSVKKKVLKQEPEAVVKKLRSYLQKRPNKILLEEDIPYEQSAYEHLERYLVFQEERVKELEAKARTIEEIHRLRLAIKKWRYLLVEYFGLSPLVLVKSQQCLGRLNDLERLQAVLENEDLVTDRIARIFENAIQDVLSEFSPLRKKLPFGLRPQVISTSARYRRRG